MENEIIFEEAQPEEIVKKIANLAMSQEDSTLLDLRKLISFSFNSFGEYNIAIIRLASRALLQKSRVGVQVLRGSTAKAFFDKEDSIYTNYLTESLICHF